MTKKSANTKSVKSYRKILRSARWLGNAIKLAYLVSSIIESPVNFAILQCLNMFPNSIGVVAKDKVLARFLSRLELLDL